MAGYSLNLPIELKQKVQEYATQQGISIDEFILWAVAEKIGQLSQQSNDLKFPEIAYRRGASGQLVPVLRGIGLRVQVVVVASQKWGLSPNQIATEYGITEKQVNEALAFYADRRAEIDEAIASEQILQNEKIFLLR